MQKMIKEAKQALRKQVRAELRHMEPGEQAAASAQARALLAAQALWKTAQWVLFFAPLPGELDIWPLLSEALSAAKRVALPRFVSETRNYEPCQILDPSVDLQVGHFGIREPSRRCLPLRSPRVDLILVPGLAFVRVGEDPASKVYVGRKEKTCAELGIFSEMHVLPETAGENELLVLLKKLNTDSRLHGILVQAPLPKQIRESIVYSTVLPQKDVDGFHPVNVGKLMLGDPTGFQPCTPAGIRELLVRSNVKTDGAEVVIALAHEISARLVAAMPKLRWIAGLAAPRRMEA